MPDTTEYLLDPALIQWLEESVANAATIDCELFFPTK